MSSRAAVAWIREQSLAAWLSVALGALFVVHWSVTRQQVERLEAAFSYFESSIEELEAQMNVPFEAMAAASNPALREVLRNAPSNDQLESRVIDLEVFADKARRDLNQLKYAVDQLRP